ncbi:LacI family DNA-binding transcriptional regulator [uncultured Amnibacterium sp.]|uniref:LacI family DNA-binding transcriptional regulator n=1 Tax=uncultured Amnibacterium sp. TaxID=1631851 RepID=UPI0035CC9D13
MHDVALLAGVSQKTVSRVLLNEQHVVEDKRRSVEQAIETLGYRRNDSARALRPGQRTMTIGLIVGDIGNPWFSIVASTVEHLVAEHGYLLVTGSTSDDPLRERNVVLRLAERRVDGLLIFPTAGDQAYLLPELDVGLEVVFLDRPPTNLVVDSVVPDHRAAARRAVLHLVSSGHRRIGYIGAGQDVGFSAAERLLGYADALVSADLPYDAALVRLGALDPDTAASHVQQLIALDHPPTALFTANNRTTIGALTALGGGLGGLALVGFDDFELAGLLPIPITVVAHDPAELARRGVAKLLDRIGGSERPAQQEILPVHLIERGSGEVRAPDDDA